MSGDSAISRPISWQDADSEIEIDFDGEKESQRGLFLPSSRQVSRASLNTQKEKATLIALPERLDAARVIMANPTPITSLDETSDIGAVKKNEASDEANIVITPGTVAIAPDQLLSCIRTDGRVFREATK